MNIKIDKKLFLAFLLRFQASKKEVGRYSENINPLLFARALSNIDYLNSTFFFWKSRNYETQFIGIGELNGYTCEEFDLSSLKDISYLSYKDIYKEKSSDDTDKTPLFIGGKKFSPCQGIWKEFKDSYWFIPRVVIVKIKETVYLNIYVCSKDIDSIKEDLDMFLDRDVELNQIFFYRESSSLLTPSFTIKNIIGKAMWRECVQKALEQIRVNNFKKVVLSRSVCLTFKTSPPISWIINRSLRKEYASCYSYLFSLSGSKHVFFGTSPELLLSSRGNTILTESVAGTIALNSSSTNTEISKNINEHNIVSNHIKGIIIKYCDKINYDDSPKFFNLHYLRHLKTSFRGILKEGTSPFTFANSIYPTPAICGYPKDKAFHFLESTENHDRGLYSGIIGWSSSKGSATELVVAIRSGLLAENRIFTFAGCGIVEGSDADNEYDESQLKMQTALDLVVNGQR